MDFVDTFTALINSAGFPVAMCVILCWYIKKQQEDNKEMMEGFMNTLAEYNLKLEALTQKINEIVGRIDK